MLNKRLAVTFGVGLAVVVIAVAWVFYIQRGAHVELEGKILKVRTQAMDENSSVAVVDFRFVNPANYRFVVRTVEVSVIGKDGQAISGQTVSEVDAKRLFEFYPVLGQKYNPSLLMRDNIAPHASEDRMITARFEVPQPQLDSRRNLKVRIEDVDGPVSELAEK